MTIWFISRHPGALEWARRNGVTFDHHVKHLDTDDIADGDTVIGRHVGTAAGADGDLIEVQLGISTLYLA